MFRRLFSRPRRARSPQAQAVLYGAAHVLDMGGTLAHCRGRFAMGPAGDALALQSDWARVGQQWGWYEPAEA